MSRNRLRRPGLLALAFGTVLALTAAANAAAPAGDRVVAHQEEPISPLPPAATANPLRVRLGERLFHDRRLSERGDRACASCHDLATNGAGPRPKDAAPTGGRVVMDTLTVFNAALSFRLNWAGTFPTLEAQAEGSIRNPQIMGGSPEQAVEKLRADPSVTAAFRKAYGRPPDAENLLDAIATFERSLLTPNSRFDAWLKGDQGALSERERRGYDLFKTVGCVSCHQGRSVGANLFQRHGIFHPLASPEPAVLRVPSLRNVAVTPPYFHDGSAATLEDAVRAMGRAQLNRSLSDSQVSDIVAFLKTLTGEYRGRPLTAPKR